MRCRNGNGQVTNYAYGDEDGLLSAVAYPGADANDLSFAYDAYDRTTATTDGAGASSTSYDDLGHVTSATRTYTGMGPVAFNYTYEPDGARATMSNPAGTWGYGYDADGRYTSMSSPAGASSATYYDNGWQATRTLPNGLKTTYGYFGTGSLGSQWNSNGSGSTTYSSYGPFTYDGAFNMTGMTSSVPVSGTQGGSTTFGYDTKDRLTSESSTRLGGYSQANAYDAAGNPTTLRGAGQSFDAENRLSGTGYAYDGNGSPTTYGGATMAYDPEARATALPGGVTAGYRADGLRAWKGSGGNRTYLYYDRGEPVFETDGNGNHTATDVYAPDGLVATVRGGPWVYFLFDAEGSAAQRTDASGGTFSSVVYDAYGKATATAGPTPTDPFGYHAQDGYLLDRESGLYLCGYRYYDPGTARWLTHDPLGASGGINVYGYCASGPVGWMDPSGLDWISNAGNWVDKNLFQGGANKLGTDWGNAEMGCASWWKVAGEAGNLAGKIIGMAGAMASGVGEAGLAGEAGEAGLAAEGTEAGEAAEGTEASSGTPASQEGEDGCSGTQCFVAGTRVVMADGSTKAVEDVRPGDRVESRSEKGDETGSVTTSTVVREFELHAPGTLLLRFSDGASVECTAVHPIYAVGRGFTPAGDLKVGDRVAEDKNGEVATLASVVRLGLPKPVYNLTVGGTHTYFVRAGDDDLWVHNADPCDPTRIKEGESGGDTAGQNFSESTKKKVLQENPDTCVYCRQKTSEPQVDHAIPKSRGGDATPGNGQTTCPWCNRSKGNRDFPVNPPPGYPGPWPPSHWGP